MTVRISALFLIFHFSGVLTLAGQQHKFSVAAEEVRLDVLVTDKGKPVSGLSAADFEIFDNGVPQEIQYVTLQKRTPVGATLVFDMSESVAGELLRDLKGAAREFLAELGEGDNAALITFNNAVVLHSNATRDLAKIRAALDEAEPFGNSALFDGSYAGLIIAESRPDPPLLIIFSDGRDTFSWLTEEAVLETAKRTEAVVYAVSTGRLPSRTYATPVSLFQAGGGRIQGKSFLRQLTKLTGGSLFPVESTRDLAATFLGILDEFRQRYLLTFRPRGVSESGWHKLDVRVKLRSAKVSARPGYTRHAGASRNQ